MDVLEGSRLVSGMVGVDGLRGLRVMVRADEEVDDAEGFGRWGCEAGRRGRTNCVAC